MAVARIAAIALAVAMLGWGSAEAAGPLRAFKIGFWSGGAYTDDRTGDFTHCSAGVAYNSGISLFILVTAGDRWWLGFVDPDWAHSPNVKLQVELRLDRGASFPRLGTVPSSHLLLVPLPDNSHLIDTLRRSAQLSLVAAGESLRFKLTDASAVLDQLTDCVRGSSALAARAPLATPATAASADTKLEQAGATNLSEPAPPGAVPPSDADVAASTDAPRTPADPPVAAAAVSPVPGPQASHESPTGSPATASSASRVPPSASAPAAPTLTAPDQPRAAEAPAAAATPSSALPQAVAPTRPTALEEIRLAQDFFTTARLPNARLVVTDKPAALASFTAVWRSDNAAGAVKIIPPGPDVSGIAIASNLIAVDPRMCQGNFATARSSATIDRSVVFSAMLSCTEADEQRSAQYFITPRRQGGFVVFAVVGSSAAGGFDRQRLDLLTKAAVRAAQHDG